MLFYCELVWIEFEEGAWGALVMLHYAGVVRYAVLVRLEGRGMGRCRLLGPRVGNIDMLRNLFWREVRWVLEREVVLAFVCGLERVVQWLVKFGEMGPNENSVMMCERIMSKGDVSPDVGEDMLIARIAMAGGSDI